MLQKKILVCDDDLDILDVTSMLLEAENFKVVIQSNSIDFPGIEKKNRMSC